MREQKKVQPGFLRRVAAAVLALTTSLALATPASALAATGWNHSGGRWWYQTGATSASYARGGWFKLDGAWYYFDAEGWMRTGWIKGEAANEWYLCDYTGAMVQDRWVQYGGAWYYLLGSGRMATNAWIGSSYVGADGVWLPDGPPSVEPAPEPEPKPDEPAASGTSGSGDNTQEGDTALPTVQTNGVKRLSAPTEWNETEAPEYYRVAGKASVSKVPAAGSVTYGGLDRYGRTTGVQALVTKEMADAGAARTRDSLDDYNPSGWGDNKIVDIELANGKTYHGYFWNRSHLLAKALGGRDSTDNLITGTRMQNVGSNAGIYGSGGMAYAENLARNWLARHPEGTLYYAATPLYQGTELIPRSVVVDVRSSDGSVDVEVEVYNAAKGYEINYARGGFTAKAPDATDDKEADPANPDLPADGSGSSGSGSVSSADDGTKPDAPSTGADATTHGQQAGDGYKHTPLPGTYIVTKSGKKYHCTENCSGLRTADWTKVRYVSLEQAIAEGLGPCSKCM